MVVPNELALQFDQLHIGVVQLAGNFGAPAVVKKAEFLFKIHFADHAVSLPQANGADTRLQSTGCRRDESAPEADERVCPTLLRTRRQFARSRVAAVPDSSSRGYCRKPAESSSFHPVPGRWSSG